MLMINREPDERWLIQQMERKHVIEFGRGFVARAKRYVAAPFRDPRLTRMMERVRPADKPTAE